MQCPICGAEAKDLTRGDFDGLVVECKHCGDYAVADSVFNQLLRLDFDQRTAARETAKAKAPAGTRPTIDETVVTVANP